MSSEKINEENLGLTGGNQPEKSASRTLGETIPQQESKSQTETELQEQEKPSGGDWAVQG